MALIPARVPARKLHERLAATLPARFPGTAFDISAGDAVVEVVWTRGPATVDVASVVEGAGGWDVRARLPWQGAETPPGRSGRRSLLVLRRGYGRRALAIGVVRYQGAYNRPYSESEERAQPRLLEILDVADPENCSFPIVGAMADMLLASDDAAVTAGALSARLQAEGYEKLWSAAYASVPL